MKDGWEVKRLGDVIVPCGTIDPTKEPDKSFHYVDVSGVSNETFEIVETSKVKGSDAPSRARRHLRSGDVLFATIRPTLKRIAVVPPNLDGEVCSTGYFVFRPKRNLDNKFLYYYLFTDKFMGAMEALQTGASYPAVNDAQVKDQTIAFPSLPEQKRIVAILDEAFAGIATATANTEKNLARSSELFECVLKAIFSQKGNGWLETKLGEICVLRSGTTVDKSLEKSVGDIPYLKVADMTLPENSDGVKTSSRFLNIPGMNKNNILPKGTVIFPKRGGAILTNKKRLTEVPICADLNIMGVIPSGSLLPEYLFMYFLNVDMRTLGSGSAIPQINNYDIEPMVISYPKSLAEQRVIVSRLDNILSHSRHLEAVYKQKLADLNSLKQSILQKAFSGELAALPKHALPDAAE